MTASVGIAVGGCAWSVAARPTGSPWRLVATLPASLNVLVLTSPGGPHAGTVPLLGN